MIMFSLFSLYMCYRKGAPTFFLKGGEEGRGVDQVCAIGKNTATQLNAGRQPIFICFPKKRFSSVYRNGDTDRLCFIRLLK